MLRLIVPVALACALVLPAMPAWADDEDAMPPPDAAAPAMPGMPDSGAMSKQLGGLEKQLQSHQSGGQAGDISLPRILKIVKALKNGGQGVTAEDIGMLREYLRKIGADSSNPELSSALDMMGQQLETLQRQRANPDEDPLHELGLDQ